MQSFFSIGDLAKIFDIPVATLRYYDQIGVFKPAITNQDTGYRYYSVEQFEKLSIIKYLRLVGVPIQEIKDIYANMNPENYIQLLTRQRAKAIREYRKMATIINKFTQRINEIDAALQCKDLNTIAVKKLPARRIMRLQERITSRSELEISVRKLEKKAMAFIDKVGMTISMDDLIKRNFKEYNSIFVRTEDSLDAEQTGLISTLEAGDYACIYYRSKHEESPPYYEMLLDYIEANNYIVAGDSIRLIIIDRIISGDQESYLAEIQIPVKKRDEFQEAE